MTFDDLCKIEPRLSELMQEARGAKIHRTTMRRMRIWYYQIKPKLNLLVGDLSHRKVLQSNEIYELAYHSILAAIPGAGQKDDQQQLCETQKMVASMLPPVVASLGLRDGRKYES